ncbi:MAG: AMIN domain-containing protein, partial [Fimbriimonadaceae bacterium]
MRFRWICLAPWMAMTVAWAAPPGDVAIQFAHNPVMKSAGTLIGDQLFVNPDFIQKIGWNFSAGNGRMTVSGEGRNLRLPSKDIEGRPSIDILEAVRLIGGKIEWSTDRKTVSIRGVIRSVEASAAGVRIDSTIGTKATAFKLSDPPRLVVDIVGAEVELERLQPLPPNHRIGQFNNNTVRFVVESPEMATVKTPTFLKSRTVAFSLSEKETTPVAAAKTGETPIVIRGATLGDSGTGQAKLTVGFSGSATQRPSARYEG